MTTRTNYYPGTCIVCGAAVPAQRGFVLPRDAVRLSVPGTNNWLTLCSSSHCAAEAVGADAIAQANARELRADGTIAMPYDEAALPFLRAIATWDGDHWQASTLLRDRDVVLRVADQLGLEVVESLRAYAEPEHVQAAVRRALAVPSIRDYQINGIRWLAYRGTTTGAPSVFADKKPGCLLADHMGLGKTLQVLLSLGDDEALIVVCPANAKAVWQREALKWRPERFDSIVICDGAESFRWPATTRELVVINYDVLPCTPQQIADERAKLEAQLKETTDDKKRARLEKKLEQNAERRPCGAPTCDVLLVADEAHYIENNKALRTVRWRHLASKVTRLYGLTGTPVEREPLKLWGLLTSLRCNPFSWTSFLRQFNGTKGRWGGYEFARLAPRPGSTSSGAVKVEPGTTEILSRVMLRRTKDDVLAELPPKIYSEIPVELPAKLIAELDEIAARHIDLLLRGELPDFADMAAVRKALAQASIPAMMEVVENFEAAGLPLVVFSAHRAPIEALGKRKGWYAITGDTSSKKRGEIQDAFQAGKGHGVAGTRAMSEAMTLTRASTVLFVDRFWEHKYNKQAEDRCHRLGQRDSVNIITLVPDHPLTEHVADLLGSKYAFVNAVLHGEVAEYAAPQSRFTDEDVDAWQARVQAKQAADATREQAEADRARHQRERSLASIAARQVTPQQSEERAKLRAQRLGLHIDTAAHVPVATVQAALSYMLSICDGARAKDAQGFNAPDSAVARWLAPGVAAGSEHAVASMAAILRNYPRQLCNEYPELFTDDKA